MRDATRCGRDAGELELAEKVVVLRQRAFTLEDLDQDSLLVVGGSREAGEGEWSIIHKLVFIYKQNSHLGLLGRDDSVPRDELRHHTTSGLDTECERAHIDEENVRGRLVTREDTTLDGSTVRDSLIGIDALRGLLATEELLEELLNLGDTSGTTNKDDLKDLVVSK